MAGWCFGAEALAQPGGLAWLAAACATAEVDLFASTHTCLPVLRRTQGAQGLCAVINNGAAGMPNFRNARFGVVTRISRHPSPHPTLYGMLLRNTYVDALAVDYDQAAWLAQFSRSWPDGTDAWLSYYERLIRGPDWEIARAAEIEGVLR